MLADFPVLADFIEWWLRQIRSLPVRRRPGLLSALPDAVIFAIDELRLEPALAASGNVLVRRDGREVPAAPLSLPEIPDLTAPSALTGGLRAGLRLPAGMVLRREVALPAAAARDLPQLLMFEMDRLTPFTADELLWSAGPARPSANREQMRFSLFLVLRQPVEALLAAFGQSGLRPSFVECETGRIELRGAARQRDNRHRATLWLCAALALACLITPIIRQQLALNAAQRQLTALAPALGKARALQARLAAAAADQAAVTAAQQEGDALRSLAALTDALPDGTWISDLTLKSGDLAFDGQSLDAAGLIAALAAIPAFQNPRFVAPVTRAPGGNADLFSIRTTVAP